jgi:hypothetical protein
MPLETPVAFFIFNRPALTERVFAAIAQTRPARLLIVSDGARTERWGEADHVTQARACVQRVDWPCEVQTNFSAVNLGCKQRIASGLDWVFGQVEEAIILEDDCLPSPAFFRFCEELLARFRHEPRIRAISGASFQPAESGPVHSYYFSKYFHCWGWATWRRAWAQYDVAMQTWPAFREAGGLELLADAPGEEAYWRRVFDSVYGGEVDTWDYQWLFANWCHGGLSVVPSVNLVSNLGFDPEATHTRDAGSRWANLPARTLGDLRHPPVLQRDRQADLYLASHVLNIRPISTFRRWRRVVRRYLAKTLRSVVTFAGL